MQKIISLFQRNYDGDRQVRDEVVPGAEWAQAGEGVATRKWDGTCCMVRDGKLYKRYDAKRGKTPPPNFEPAQEEADPITGHWPGWVPVGDGPGDRWHREACKLSCDNTGGLDSAGKWSTWLPDGTYELVGPQVNANPEHFYEHTLLHHGDDVLEDAPRTYNELKEWFGKKDIEGIVWHHPDGRMVKIKKKDFGLPRKPAEVKVT